MKLLKSDLEFMLKLSRGTHPKWDIATEEYLRLAQGRMIEPRAGLCWLSAAGERALEDAQRAQLI